MSRNDPSGLPDDSLRDSHLHLAAALPAHTCPGGRCQGVQVSLALRLRSHRPGVLTGGLARNDIVARARGHPGHASPVIPRAERSEGRGIAGTFATGPPDEAANPPIPSPGPASPTTAAPDTAPPAIWRRAIRRRRSAPRPVPAGPARQ